MKKILSFILVFFMLFSMANAQTVENSRVFENTYVTLYGGGITTTHTGGQPFFWDGAANIVKGVRPLAGLEVGKYVTPVVGFGIEGLAMFGTTGSNTFVDQSNVVGNLKLNLSNWFGGYKGEPRRVEVVFVPGLGWGHDYGDVYYDRDYLTYNLGAELDVNLGKAKALQIVVKPVVMWNNYGTPNGNILTPILPNMQARLQVGLSYKFGSRRTNSHNFVLCPYSVTADDYAAAKALIAELEAREPVVKEVVKEVVVEKVVEKQVPVVYGGTTVVAFKVGSSVLSDVEKAKLNRFAMTLDKNVRVHVLGSADSKTGTETRNYTLAQERADAVKDYLVKEFGLTDVLVSTTLDINDVPAASRAAEVNVIID